MGRQIDRIDACGADADLIALAKACLAADPNDRPANAAAVAEAIAAHLNGVQDRLRAAEFARLGAGEDRQGASAQTVERGFGRNDLSTGCRDWWRLGLDGAATCPPASRDGGGGQRGARKGDPAPRTARVTPVGDLPLWTEALALVVQTQGILVTGEPDPVSKSRVDRLEIELKGERSKAEEAEKDRLMVELLNAIRTGGSGASACGFKSVS